MHLLEIPVSVHGTARPCFASDAARWAAVRERDARADGHFVCAVKTTGVYAAPSGFARLPRRENVEFFGTAEAARAAGYRPSRRAEDDAARAMARAQAVARACRLIEEAPEPPPLAALARAAGMSPSRLHRAFRAEAGITPRAYGAAVRAARLRRGLGEAGGSITSAIYAAGFNASSRFYESADALLGMPAGQFRAGGAGAVIRFAVGQCALGAILVAQSARGVCAILLGDDPEALLQDLQDRFAQAQLVGADAAFERLVAQVVGFVEAPAAGLALPLDVRGTAFQQRVWEALRRIPAGQTASYADIARHIGVPRAARAVAQACAANPLAVVIPCHRVVRRDGDLSGYRWGVERKRELLRREGVGAPVSIAGGQGATRAGG